MSDEEPLTETLRMKVMAFKGDSCDQYIDTTVVAEVVETYPNGWFEVAFDAGKSRFYLTMNLPELNRAVKRTPP